MLKVKPFCDWDNDSYQLIERLKEQTDGMEGNVYRDIEFVHSGDYDVAMFFNFPQIETTKPYICLLLEPPEIMDSMYPGWRDRPEDDHTYAFTYGTQYQTAFGLGFATVPTMKYPKWTEKTKKACMIVSNKIMTPFHVRRRELFDALLASDIDIHFYGRGMSGGDKRIYGEIPPMGKHHVLKDYKYCIDFENSPLGAVTDKFFDPILCNTIPITNAGILNDLLLERSFIDIGFDWRTELILAVIQNEIEKDWEYYQSELERTQFEIRSGDLCMVKWIYDRVQEL